MEKKADSLLMLIFCTLGVFFAYFVYGILQENITKTKYGPKQQAFTFIKPMLLIQCFVNSAFAYFGLCVLSEQKSSISEKQYAVCGFSYIGAMFSSNSCLRYLNYPTQVIGKSIKPIPVMILSVIWASKRYPLKKYVFVSMITIGVILFMYKDKSSTNKDVGLLGWGELLLLVSLALDGLTGGMQEDFRSNNNVGPCTMMFKLNKWSIIYLSIGIIFTGETLPFLDFVSHFPLVLLNIVMFGVVSAVGQMFIYTTIVKFGPLMCSIVTTTRKFFTVLASIIIFDHALTSRQIVGTGLVFLGLLLDQMFGKVKKSENPVASEGDDLVDEISLSPTIKQKIT